MYSTVHLIFLGGQGGACFTISAKKQLSVPVNKHSFIFGTSKRYTKYVYGYNELLIMYPLYFEKPLSYRLFIIFIKCLQTDVYFETKKCL